MLVLVGLVSVLVGGAGAAAGVLAGGATHPGLAVKAPQCPEHPAPGHGASYAGSCDSPDGAWHLRIRGLSGSQSKLFLSPSGRSTDIPAYTSPGCCLQWMTWAKPHLLLFIDDFQVMSLNPAAHETRHLAQLDDLAVSPDGRWFAGRGAGTLGSNVYVLSADARTCLVVPGGNVSVQGFTRDSKAIIVLRYPKTLVQYTISSLDTGCPAGYDGVLLHRG